ncbi:hypothetical protein EBS02_00365 [bacterium]|nr:hypothetical protein [bacterium]
MENIQSHIDKNKIDLYDAGISSQRRRYLECELDDLLQYQENHPNEIHDPTKFELFCDAHPEALECRIYEN